MLNRKLIRSNSFPCLALNQSIFPPASRSHINRLWSFVVWASHPPHPPNKDADKNAVDLSDKPGLLGHWSASLRAKKFVYNLLIQFYWKMVFKRLFSSKNQEEQWNGRWLTKHKELHRHQLLKNNLHNIVSFLSCFPWNLICAIHSALFRDMKENYFLHKSHKNPYEMHPQGGMLWMFFSFLTIKGFSLHWQLGTPEIPTYKMRSFFSA